MIVVVVAAYLFGSCGYPSPPRSAGESKTVNDPAPFDGQVREPGEADGAIHWDYGANPRGTIDDPIEWVRDNAVGLDPTLELSFVDEFRSSTDIFPNLVMAKHDDGLVVAFVEFGRDGSGRYFPNQSEMCASAGIQEFG